MQLVNKIPVSFKFYSNKKDIKKDEEVSDKAALKLLKKEEKRKAKENKKMESKRLAYERSEVNKFNSEWVKLMAYMGIKNAMDETFTLRDIKYESYGFSTRIHTPMGLTLCDLENEKNINIIQDNLKCLFIAKKIPKTNYTEAKFICKDIPCVDFEPIKLPPYELYMSTGLDGKPMTSNMLDYPHVLVTGSTGMGKSKFVDLMMVNLITTTSIDDVSFYILQADKCDQLPYSYVKHCQGYEEEIEGIYSMLKYILTVVEKRKAQIKPLFGNGVANNIKDYNDAIDKGVLKGVTKWRYLYVVVDEYASLMPEGEFNNEKKKIKQMIQAMMERILQIGRYVGLYAIISTQRATVDKLPSFIKAMSNTIVSFRTSNRKSSEIAIDTGDAVNLKKREFITKIEETYFGKTVNLTQADILKWIKPYSFSNPISIKYNEYNDIDDNKDVTDNSKKKKRATKEERKKKKDEFTNNEVKVKTSNKPKAPEVKSNLDRKPKVSEYYVENWTDPLSNPNIRVIDETKPKTKQGGVKK